MQIGFIGAGRVAQSIARYATAAGHTVLFSSRSSDTAAKAALAIGEGAMAGTLSDAAAADLTILAVPWRNVEVALKGVPDWTGRLLVDATNPFLEVSPKAVFADLGDGSASEIVAAFATGASVVKAFNSLMMTNFDKAPDSGVAKRVLFISGDDAADKALVADLIRSFGFAVVDLGGLATGGRMQQPPTGPLAGPDFLLSN